jgi:signal transduction histidine kinase
MRQVLGNVLGNAYKYSPDGGQVTCTTVIREQGRQVQFGIKIQDQGIGMTPEELSRVGERFYRADSSGAIPGTGLGVSLVKEIMEIHKGEVEISSAKDRGTTVVLWLPVISDQVTARAV